MDHRILDCSIAQCNCPACILACTAPDGTVPDGTVQDGAVPDGTVPDGTVPVGTVPVGIVLVCMDSVPVCKCFVPVYTRICIDGFDIVFGVFDNGFLEVDRELWWGAASLWRSFRFVDGNCRLVHLCKACRTYGQTNT